MRRCRRRRPAWSPRPPKPTGVPRSAWWTSPRGPRLSSSKRPARRRSPGGSGIGPPAPAHPHRAGPSRLDRRGGHVAPFGPGPPRGRGPGARRPPSVQRGRLRSGPPSGPQRPGGCLRLRRSRGHGDRGHGHRQGRWRPRRPAGPRSRVLPGSPGQGAHPSGLRGPAPGLCQRDRDCRDRRRGPGAAEAIRQIIATDDPFLAAVLADGTEVLRVTHFGRKPTAKQKTALEWLYPTCSVDGCGARARLEVDHTRPGPSPGTPRYRSSTANATSTTTARPETAGTSSPAPMSSWPPLTSATRASPEPKGP
jgi:hypothetical protein